MTRSLFRQSTLAGLIWAVAGAPSPAAAQQTDIQRLTLGHYLDMDRWNRGTDSIGRVFGRSFSHLYSTKKRSR